MKLFMWNEVGALTQNYHDGGGLVVIADTLERAREMVAAKSSSCEALITEPDVVRECEGPELMAIHQDAGCC